MKKAIVAAASTVLLLGCDTLTEDRTPTADCVTGTWWVGGDTGHEEMHPGQDCVGCHRENDGPPLALGGTIYPLEGQADDCYGLPGVTVEVTDANGAITLVETNEAGNFFIEGDESVVPKPYTIRLTAGLEPPGALLGTGGSRQMFTPPLTGDCAFCHVQTPDPTLTQAGVRIPIGRIDANHTLADWGVLPAATVATPAAGGTGGI